VVTDVQQSREQAEQETRDDVVRVRARMRNPAMVVPDAARAIQGLNAAITSVGVPGATLELVHLRASQINGCSFCVDLGLRNGKKSGETDERLFAVSAWRDAPFYTAAERAALALTEAVTRLSDREDPVPDAIWDEAARHFSEPELSALLLMIATTNLYNRLNVPTRQVAGTWG